MSFASEAAELQIINADRYLDQAREPADGENVLPRRKAWSSLIQAECRKRHHGAVAEICQARIENVARYPLSARERCGVSLAAEGVTFAGILEDLRSALAKHYLAEQDHSISRIAWLLGYTEVSSFSHAFRRWDWAYAARRPTAAATPASSDGCKAAATTLGPAPKKLAFWHCNASFCPNIASFFQPHALSERPTNKLTTNLGTFARAIDDD